MAVKIVVLFLSNFRFVSGPQGACHIYGFRFAHEMHDDGERNMVGELADDLADFAGICVLIVVGFQIQRDFCSARNVFFFFDGERPRSFGRPQPTLFFAGFLDLTSTLLATIKAE